MIAPYFIQSTYVHEDLSNHVLALLVRIASKAAGAKVLSIITVGAGTNPQPAQITEDSNRMDMMNRIKEMRKAERGMMNRNLFVFHSSFILAFFILSILLIFRLANTRAGTSPAPTVSSSLAA